MALEAWTGLLTAQENSFGAVGIETDIMGQSALGTVEGLGLFSVDLDLDLGVGVGVGLVNGQFLDVHVRIKI